MQVRTKRSICIYHGILTCIHTWSAAGYSLQWVGGLSKQYATYLLSWSSPFGRSLRFWLTYCWLTPDIAHLVWRMHAMLLQCWLGCRNGFVWPISEQTCPTLHHRLLQLCWICHTLRLQTSPGFSNPHHPVRVGEFDENTGSLLPGNALKKSIPLPFSARVWHRSWTGHFRFSL